MGIIVASGRVMMHKNVFEIEFDKLSNSEINEILINIVYEYKGEDRFVLLEKIFNRIYSRVESEFYLSVLKCEDSKGISNLVEQYAIDQYDNLMFCQRGLKIFWEVEAEILLKKGYSKVKDSISYLFRWLQDLNWPGAEEITSLLLSFPTNEFVANLEYATVQAFTTNDDEWLINLQYIARQKQLKRGDFNHLELFEKLMNFKV